MAETWEDEGAWGSAARVPVGEWFPVNTATGDWQLPGQPTLARSAGMPDVTAPPVWGGTPDQAPLSIGQVAGTLAPQLGPQSRLARAARASEQGLLAPQPTMWESLARAVGMASPGGRAILQGFDQQQQQDFRNRLLLRQEQRQEADTTRQAKERFLTNMEKIGKVGNQELQTLLFNRAIADYQTSTGESLPADFVETYRKANAEKRRQLGEFMTPLLTAAGMDADKGMALLGNTEDPKPLLDMIELRTKQKRQEADEAEEARLTKSRQTLFGASTGVVPSTTAPSTPPPPPPAGAAPTPTPTAARPGTVSTGLDIAVTEATKLYPQVRPDLVHGIIRHESNYDVGAVSPKGAVGPMQLMPGTAKDLGVDPTDPAQNVRGGVRYYAQLLTKYGGNEALALAAYNWGPGNVDKVGGDLTKMPAETQAYVKQVLGTAASGQRGPAGTQGQVAGPGAPATAGAGTDQAQLTRLNQQIAAMDQFLAENLGSGRERTKGMVNEVQQERMRLIQEREKLTEPQRAGQRAAAESAVTEQSRIRVAGEAERLRAENERASPGEIDAVNLLLPPDKKVPYGTTRAELKARNLVGAEKLSPPMLEQFSDRAAVVRQLDELQRTIGALQTGPIAGRLEAIKQATGLDVKDEAVAYRTLLSAVHNQLALARGGKALTPQEITRIEKELPTERDPASVFPTKLKTALKVAEGIYRLKAQFARKAGYGVPEDLMSPYEPTGLETQEGKDLLGDMKSGNRPK